MTFPDDPNLQNIERPLPELPALRELVQRDRARADVRNAIKSRVQRTLHNDTAAFRAPRPARPLLIAAAVTVAVPGALAATGAGRTWLSEALNLLPWITSTPEPDPRRQAPQRAGPEALKRVSAASTEESTPATSVAVAVFDAVESRVEAPPAPSSGAVTNGTRAPNPAADTMGARAVARPDALDIAPRVNSANPSPSAAASTGPSTPTFTGPAQLQAERMVLEAARRALAVGDYVEARSWCMEHRSQFSKPVLAQERGVIEAMIDAASATPQSPRP